MQIRISTRLSDALRLMAACNRMTVPKLAEELMKEAVEARKAKLEKKLQRARR